MFNLESSRLTIFLPKIWTQTLSFFYLCNWKLFGTNAYGKRRTSWQVRLLRHMNECRILFTIYKNSIFFIIYLSYQSARFVSSLYIRNKNYNISISIQKWFYITICHLVFLYILKPRLTAEKWKWRFGMERDDDISKRTLMLVCAQRLF